MYVVIEEIELRTLTEKYVKAKLGYEPEQIDITFGESREGMGYEVRVDFKKEVKK